MTVDGGSMKWQESDQKLSKEFVFTDFKQAFIFMTAVAEVAERLQHHPEWSNVYNKVAISLSTHEAGDTVTDKDRGLASEIDKLAQQIGIK